MYKGSPHKHHWEAWVAWPALTILLLRFSAKVFGQELVSTKKIQPHNSTFSSFRLDQDLWTIPTCNICLVLNLLNSSSYLGSLGSHGGWSGGSSGCLWPTYSRPPSAVTLWLTTPWPQSAFPVYFIILPLLFFSFSVFSCLPIQHHWGQGQGWSLPKRWSSQILVVIVDSRLALL